MIFIRERDLIDINYRKIRIFIFKTKLNKIAQFVLCFFKWRISIGI